jgi:Rieske Fe-S protein
MRAAAGAIAATVSGCASVTAFPVRTEAGAFRIVLREHPTLALPGGHIRVRPDTLAHAVHIVRVGEGFVALSPVCQHLGCTVEFEGSRFVCPCHGSMYDRDGSVLRGPTERPLIRYSTDVTGDGVLLVRTETA